MSSYGVSGIDLERIKMEEIRKEEERKRKEQVRARIGDIKEQLKIIELGLSSSGDLNHVMNEFNIANETEREVDQVMENDIDKAYEIVQTVKATMSSLHSLAQERKMNRKMELNLIHISIVSERERALDVSLDAKRESHKDRIRRVISRLDMLLSEFDNGCRQGMEGKLGALKKETSAIAQDIREFQFRESQRRYVLRSLKTTMEDMGFITAKPKLLRDSNQVVLTGKMPSGRTASFRVDLEGGMEFDLEGYMGRECGKDIDRVLETLSDRFECKCSPPQHNWKNPNRISKGSKGFPTGGKSMSAGDGRR